jgi:hypothetical protein
MLTLKSTINHFSLFLIFKMLNVSNFTFQYLGELCLTKTFYNTTLDFVLELKTEEMPELSRDRIKRQFENFFSTGHDMVNLNELLRKPYFHLRCKLSLFSTILMLTGTLFHAIYLSEKLASQHSVARVRVFSL